MSSKIQTLAQLAADTASRLTGSFTDWTAFLQTAARLYKYPYHEQVMIYAQRPDATACASFDLWKQRMGRAVRRGSKGIAIVDTSQGGPQVKYVFDIGDTVGGQNARRPYLWALDGQNQRAAAQALSNQYDISDEMGLEWQLESAARILAEESWEENQDDILDSVAGSFLEELDEANIKAGFCEACAASTHYVLLARCGLDPDSYLQHEDFLSVFDFNTPAAVTALGTAVSRNSETILRQIEITVKNFERAQLAERGTHGRDTVQAGGGLPAPGAGDGTAPDIGQIRPAADGISERVQASAVQPADPGRDVGPALGGDRPDSGPAAGIADAPVTEIHGDNGGPESPGPHEVGGADEQREASGGGDDPGGTGVQLEDGFGQFSLFGAAEFTPLVNTPQAGGSGLSQAVIDEALRIGANDPSSRLRIIAEFMKDKPVEENARFLQAHYKENGAGFYVGERKYALWYDEAGMLISPGESAHGNFETALTWEQAAIRIRELLDAGEYASQLMVYRAWPFERGRVAEALVFLQRDIAEDAQDRYFPTLHEALEDVLGHPDRLNKVKELLQEPESLQKLVDECGAFLSAYAHDRELLRFHYHRTDGILQGLKDLQLEPIKFTAAEGFTPQRRLFISQDEIDKLLREDASRHDYRLGIVKFFEQHPDKKERKKYLSGIHGVYSGFHGGNDNIVYTSKGVEFSHGDIVEPYAKVELKWGAVRKRIEELIKKDAFLSAEDKEVLEGRYLEGPAADGQETTPAPTVRDLYQQYKPMVLAAVMEDTAYRNACRNSDEASARLECDAAIKRVAASASNLQFAKLYYDMQEFHARLHRDVWEETYPALSADKQETKPRYQVVVYHHFENGFDEKLDYPTLAEAEKTARRHLDGSMEDDGFQYEGAAVYDLQEKKWLRVFGHFPHERAQEQVRQAHSLEDSAAPAQMELGAADAQEPIEDEPGFIADYPDEEPPWGIQEGEHSPWGEVQASRELAAGVYKISTAGHGGILIREQDAPGLLSSETLARGGKDFGWCYFEEDGLAPIVVRELEEKGVITRPSPRSPQAPAYKVGDTVYLDDTAFVIENIGLFDVHLKDPALAYPILRAEPKERFEQLLRRDERNLSITDYLPSANMADMDDLRDILAGEEGMLSQKDKDAIIGWLQSGQGNTAIAENLASIYTGSAETIPLETGEKAGCFAHEDSFEINIQDKFGTRHTYSWETVASVLRGLWQQGLYGFGQEHPVQETVAPEPPPLAEKPPKPTSTIEAIYPAEKNNLPFEIIVEKLYFPEQEKPAPAHNFRITDDNLGVGGAKAHYKMNVDAIRLLRQLQGENRQATPEEQGILSKYVGWGGLSDAFDEAKPAWASEYKELRELLSPEEYASARGSTLNAHYTIPVVIRAMYQALGNMGFQGGNILEPSMGVGNFFGCLPESMAASKLYGVELDSITGQIAKQLYPQADITVAGFETTDRHNFYDLAIGNVPFGNYQVHDPAYNRLGFSIHNYFFAKALDQVRPGGIVAFLTSRYTLDSKDTKVRKYLAGRADLLGAVRLPNSTFKANAGTEVIEDILFLQKRESPAVETPSWVQTGETPLGFQINQYFLDNPHMVLGTEQSTSGQYGRQEYSVAPFPDAVLSEQLAQAITHIHGQYREAEPPELDLEEGKAAIETLPAGPDVKNFSYTIKNGDVYYRQNSIMVKQDLGKATAQRVKGLLGLRDCVQKLIGQQLDGFVSDESIRKTQAELGALYDDFSQKFGLINDRGNRLAFSQDSSYYLLCALEVLDDEGHFLRKADMFTKRTIQPHMETTHVDTATEALAVSIGERARVDIPFMAQLTGKTEDEIITELRGQVFRVPLLEPPQYVTADEYLSGNVREKLAEAQAAAASDPSYQANADALAAVQPKDLDASEIDVRLGATWVDPEYYEQFMLELLETPRHVREYVHVSHSDVAEIWSISGKSSIPLTDIPAYTTYGTGRANAYRLLEDALNLRTTRIYDTVEDADGREKRVLNSKETMLAQEKQQLIKLAFQDWIFRDPDRRQTLVRKYNVEMNSTRPREYNGDYLVLAGMNPAITLEKHQKDAIARAVYGGNTLFAHCVGAGKTFEMTASAMEMKRLGLCHKSMIVVPNHLTQQWASAFLTLYPSANILVTTKRDFETSRRKKFCARIATGDYDAVIIGCSQFEKIPVSAQRQQALLEREIDEIAEGIARVKESNGERFTVKAMERTRKSLEAKLEKLRADEHKDSVISFEELGVDRLFVDESDTFKNLFFVTKMQNVAGLSASESQRASDMFAKTRYLDELTGSKGVIFATGTPISNSIAEMYTVQRYLQYETLQKMGMVHFDSWASRFGETVTSMELAPEGTGYRQRTRFAKFHNLPELMNLFHEVADIKTADQLNLPTPEAVYHNEVAKPSEFQLQYLKKLSERATKIHNREVEPSQDNMLVITNDGRKLGLDQRLIDPAAGDAPASKLNMCVENIAEIWRDGAENRLTQLVFCDSSTPKKGGGFNVYDDIKAKLIARGIPENEIAFIHDANSDTQKKALFAKVRSGTVRVLLGSTEKMGAGTNCQDRLISLHNLDCPWRPRDLTQREGRIKRRGNQNPTVHIYRYVTENTFDSYLWQTVQKKQEFIGQILTSKSPVRSCEDIDSTAMDFAEVKALCAGDPRIKERMELDIEVSKLKILQASHRSQQYRLEDRVRLSLPKEQEDTERRIQCLREDITMAEAHPQPAEGFVGMEICGKMYMERKDAGAALMEAAAGFEIGSAEKTGQYRGFSLCIRRRTFSDEKEFLLKGKLTYVIEPGDSGMGNVMKIENALTRLPAELEKTEGKLENIKQQIILAQAEIGKPFPQEQELKDKIARMAELDRVLQLEEKGGQEMPHPENAVDRVKDEIVL